MKNIILYLLSFFLTNICNAEQQSLKTFSNDVFKETGRVFTTEFRPTAKGLKLATAITAGGLFLYSQDGQIRRLFFKNKSKTADNLSTVLEKFGNGGYEAIFILTYGGMGALIKNDYMRDTAILAGESFLVANTAGTFLKYSLGRSRPYTEDGKNSFSPFSMKSSRTSMPSGHTVSAFSLASVFAERADSNWVKFFHILSLLVLLYKEFIQINIGLLMFL